MGLDWKPLGRAKAGKEAALDDVVRGLRGLDGPSSTGFLARLFKRRSNADIDRERSQLVERYRELSEPPYATLGAPRVGFDDAANQWILEKWRAARNDVDERTVIENNHGLYVLDLLPECDGFPVYSNSTVNPALERYCFRGSFLDDVKAELGDERYARAWTLMTAAELFTYGKEIAAIAKRYSANNNLTAIANAREAPDGDGTPASKAHILASAARWCVYWAERGHGLEPDF